MRIRAGYLREETRQIVSGGHLVQLDNGAYGLIELELMGPSRYLRMDANAPERFAAALDTRIRSRTA
jgi:hypothetical protein